jgi:hypothetical protein
MTLDQWKDQKGAVCHIVSDYEGGLPLASEEYQEREDCCQSKNESFHGLEASLIF